MTELEDAPKLIGRYELLTRLATGGMAELFLARERGLAGLERIVVIKRILPHLADQPSFVDMFLREARIVARLSHPNVVQIYDLGQEQDSYHIAMEYIHGSTVRESLLLAQKQDRQMPCDVAVAVAEQSCRGLHAAHELSDLDGKALGLVHRDISPHNLMCTTDGHVKLLDFGVAKSTSASVEATYSGNLKGKFAYLSPEQCLHEPLDRRSDVFAMGIVMWEMLTMRRLFKRKSELDMMQSVIAGEVPPPQKFRPEVPLPVQEVVLRALKTDREDRFESADAMRKALLAAADASNLTLDEERVATFLHEVAGERLAERQATVESACERELTRSERKRLLHMTGTSSRSVGQELESGEPTVVERPQHPDLELDAELTQQTPAEQIESLVAADRDRKSQTGDVRPDNTKTAVDEEEQQVDAAGGGRRRGPILAIGAVLLVALGGLLVFGTSMVSGDDEDHNAQADDPALETEAEVVADDDQYSDIVVSGEPLTLGWAPTIPPDVLRQEVEPLHRYLETRTGRPAPMQIASDYSSLSRQLRNGEITAAVLPPTLYVLTSEHDEGVEILLMREFDGTASSDGHLLVRRGGDIHSLQDLEGKKFCFVDRVSTSGHLLPRHFIRSQGHDPDEFVGEIHWSGDHFQGMRDLIAGKCDAAAVYSGAYLSADDYDIRTGRVSSLALTGQLPQDVVAVSAATSEDDRQLLRQVLVDFDPFQEFGIERLGKNQRITGFLQRDDRDFETLREIVEQEGLSFQDL